MSDQQPWLDVSRREYVTSLIAYVHDELQQDPQDGADLLALLGLARSADLLRGELALFDAQMPHLAPVLGRTLIETCLYVQYLVLSPDEAVERLDQEANDQQRRLRAGSDRLRDLAAVRAVLDESVHEDELGPATPPNVADLSRRVSDLRAALGHGEIEGFSRVAYEMDYRWRSANEVHPGIVVFGRYMNHSVEPPTLRTLPSIYPHADDLDAPQQELRQDAYLLEDTLALRLAITEHRDLVGRSGGRLVILSLNDVS